MPTPIHLDRRTLLKSLAFAAAASSCGVAFGDDQLHQPLAAWTEGHFDIHQIDTARGNSALLIFPDGTTLLIDAGDVLTAPADTTNPGLPNASHRPGEWIARYVLAHAPKPHLDYFLATHIHGDHVDGLRDVAAKIPITTCIDRAFPNYEPNQLPASAPFAQNYLAYLRSRTQSNQAVEAAQVGSTTQIRQHLHPDKFPTFGARILSANGNIWNPATNAVDAHLANTTHAYENNFSIATRFTYGAFSYFTGGDLNCDTFDGRIPELDIESPVARAAGRTEVAVADHHGYFDACGPAFTSSLNAQAYIIPSWDIGHPGSAQMQRMTGAWDDNGGTATHDVFAVELLPANALLNRRFAPQLKSQSGHIVVRVAPGGDTYTIYTLDPTIENGSITGTFGPYQCRA